MSPSISLRDFFALVGAPLHNYRWSWGAVRRSDGVVFLRVWQDEEVRHEGRTLMRLTNHAVYQEAPEDLGYQERVTHVEFLREGATCFLVMCVAESPRASPRSVKTFDSKTLFLAGGLIELNGDTWIELGRRVPLATVRAQPDPA